MSLSLRKLLGGFELIAGHIDWEVGDSRAGLMSNGNRFDTSIIGVRSYLHQWPGRLESQNIGGTD